MGLPNYPRSAFGPSRLSLGFGLAQRGLDIALGAPLFWTWRVGLRTHFSNPISINYVSYLIYQSIFSIFFSPYYKKITVLQWIFPLQIRCKPIKIRCKSLLATDLQQKCFVAKKPCCNFAHFGIRLQKTNRFAMELFRCYIATNFTSVANLVAKSQK